MSALKKIVKASSSLTLLAISSAVYADFEPLKPGDNQWGLTVVGTYQDSDLNSVESESLYSFDLAYTTQFDGFGVYAWWEYSKAMKSDGVSSAFELANGDAGTITDSNGQFSELYMFGGVGADGEPSWRIGINEVTTLVDRSDIANDEVEQFLSLGLVNNLTIAFPDYAFSGFFQDLTAFGNIGYRIVLSSSHGFADNESGSYGELVSFSGNGKGYFSALEVVYTDELYRADIGVWNNSADEAAAEYGAYLSLDLNDSGINFRYGYADAELQSAEHFSGLAWRKKLEEGEFAVGYTYTRYNRSLDPTVHQAEVYYRWHFNEQVYLSPSLQLSDDKSISDDAQWIFTLRTELSF